MTSWPRWTSSRAPAGVSATRYSSVLISFATPIFMQGPGNDTPLALPACAPLGSLHDAFGAERHRHVTFLPVRSKAGGGPGCPSGCEPRPSEATPRSAASLALLEIQEQPRDRLRVLE